MSRKTSAVVSAALALIVFAGARASAQSSDCWGFTDVDPLFTYTTNATHVLPNGLVGSRNPAGAHSTPLHYTEMTGSSLRMRGGADDHLIVEAPLASVPSDWMLTVHYRTAVGCSSRELMLIEEVGGFVAYTLLGDADLNGSGAAFTSLTDTWYTTVAVEAGTWSQAKTLLR